MIAQKVNGSSKCRTAPLALASALALMALVAPVSAQGDETRPAPAEAIIEKEASALLRLDLPPVPDVTLQVDAVETPSRAAEADITLPAAPEIELSEDLRAPAAPVQQAETPVPKLDLPEPPTVTVAVDLPPPPRLVLPADEAAIRAALEPARTRYRFKATEMDALAGFYAARDFRPVWLEARSDGAFVQSRVATLSKLAADAEQEGLDAVRLLSALPVRTNGIIPAERLIETDLAISVAAFLYARDARGGRIEPSRLSGMLTPELTLPNPAELLASITDQPADKLTALLHSYHPRHAGYRALRAELMKLREEMSAPILTGSVAGLAGAPQPVAAGLPPKWLEGPALAFGKPDPRVLHLRSRLGLPAEGGEVYDAELRKAVEAFQRVNGLTPNGRITPKTRAALENPQTPVTESERKPDKQVLANTIIANMERWRWLPVELGEFHVFVNVPDFKLQIVQDGRSVHETRVIVGKPQTQTPVFSDEMEHLIVNPSWGVPPSILKKEFLPKLATDPDYATRRGFEVVRRGNSISIRQPPGEKNALGFVKFMFPNNHSVYLHDTPNRSLFGNDFRAFSHGCVRVDKPFAFAEKLLSTSLGYSEGYLRGMIGRGERMVRLPRRIPVHLSYFTVFVDAEGKLQERRDLYGHDARVRSALQL
ncbi:L,D-transpeptidase family protein [Rhabdaerophilum sp. SD176]|uniref:L,D-transpeptidase family protein n=1 Tax=Rhabdaerophilum sp. SD176 TaxID=2983548 RepID=UPI0024DF788A|nr:L,D-transpeptidase family protein [Rhabdaerophilum sp. SD176]